MQASPTQIIEFFNGFKQSMIPLFQRRYEWTRVNWEALWQDLLERYEAASDPSQSHFMGAIVTMPYLAVPVGVAKHLVIDGQQRLITFAVLLCAVRDKLSAEAPQRTKIQGFYLTNHGCAGLDYFKLLPTQDDREGFIALVRSEQIRTEWPMHAAYRFFAQKIENGDTDGNPIDALRLLDTTERKFMVVNINLTDTEDPYLIFESLNAKGSPLTQADLVRNYFLMRISITAQDSVYQQLWLPMERRLGDNLTEFIRHYLMRTGDEVLKDDIYLQLKRRMQERSQAEIRSDLEEMNRVSVHYLRLINPREESDPDVQTALSQLIKWDVTTSYPLVLKLYDAYESNTVPKEDFCQCLKNIESFVVRRWVCNVPTNQLKRIFLQAAKAFTETNTLAWLRDSLSAGSSGRRWPSDEEFNKGWMDYKVYSNPRRCKFILEALERDHGHKEPASLDDATIEHVMPQTITSDWLSVLSSDGDPNTAHESLVDTIGNLTLTGYNPELSNMAFDEKKKIYVMSNYSLNGYFSDCDIWDINQIRQRGGKLWERARELWPTPVPASMQSGLLEAENQDTPDREQKRELILRSFCRRERVELLGKSGSTLYSDAGGTFRVACLVSRRYARNTAYWYGYTDAARQFLAGGKKAFLILGCLDSEIAFPIPSFLFEGLLSGFPKSTVGQVKWHIHLKESDQNNLEIAGDPAINLNDFALSLEASITE